MFKKILVPLDGSKLAEKILPHVEDLAHRYAGSQVILLRVVDPVPSTIYMNDAMVPMDPAIIDRIYKDARGYLEKIQARFQAKKVRAHVHVSLGPVVGTILDLAQLQKADLIAMTSHGRSGLPEFFYGSVAAGVLHRSDRPLLIVRAIPAPTAAVEKRRSRN